MDQSRPRPKSGFSFRSSKSDESGGAKPKVVVDWHETDEEKRRRRMKEGTKANPNSAINEAQPAVVASHVESTLGNLRLLKFNDQDGNAITEPDLSNPSRSRFERPLDTIRSFERAIDGSFGRPRHSFHRAESDYTNGPYGNRRSGYFGSNSGMDTPGNRMSQMSGYYGARTPGFDHGHGGNPRPRFNSQRMNSEPMFPSQRSRFPPSSSNYENGGGIYPSHQHHQSHDTVGTGYTHGSDSTGPWANSTNPSSENSSVDRVYALKSDQHDANNGYGYPQQQQQPYHGSIPEDYQMSSNGHGGGWPSSRGDSMNNPAAAYGQPSPYGQQSQQQQYHSTNPYHGAVQQPQHQFNDEGPPPPPKHNMMQPPQQTAPTSRRLSKLSSPPDSYSYDSMPQQRPPYQSQNSDKRKSWFKRRFSRAD